MAQMETRGNSAKSEEVAQLRRLVADLEKRNGTLIEELGGRTEPDGGELFGDEEGMPRHTSVRGGATKQNLITKFPVPPITPVDLDEVVSFESRKILKRTWTSVLHWIGSQFGSPGYELVHVIQEVTGAKSEPVDRVAVPILDNLVTSPDQSARRTVPASLSDVAADLNQRLPASLLFIFKGEEALRFMTSNPESAMHFMYLIFQTYLAKKRCVGQAAPGNGSCKFTSPS